MRWASQIPPMSNGNEAHGRFPYRVELTMPANGMRGRYGAALRAACTIAGYSWDAWQRRGERMVVAFSRSKDAESFRDWIARQGWTDLLAS
jgi:hypothetical protein